MRSLRTGATSSVIVSLALLHAPALQVLQGHSFSLVLVKSQGKRDTQLNLTLVRDCESQATRS